MSKTYTDYINRTAITVPEEFIDVKSGETHLVSSKMIEEMEYHADNQTLIHLVLSALHQYFHPNRNNKGSEEILLELADIKHMLKDYQTNHSYANKPRRQHQPEVKGLDIKEIEDILEGFGG